MQHNVEVLRQLTGESGVMAAYAHIPFDQIKNFLDSSIPSLAKNSIADAATGNLHRWKEGHDLLIDVSNTLFKNGPLDAAKQAGHIVLTDFPTKAGIPIPMFSQSGLGKFLASIGIPKGFLCVNFVDAGLGIFAIAEGSNDLIAAFQGNLEWSTTTFFDTFVEGTIEIAFGYATKNPLLIIAGAENYIAGIKSLYDYAVEPRFLGVPVDTLLSSFGGGFIVGAIIGFAFSHNLPIDQRIKNALSCGLQSGTFSTLFAINPLIGTVALFSYQTLHFAKHLAKRENKALTVICRINYLEMLALLDEYCKLPPQIRPSWTIYDVNDPKLTAYDDSDHAQNLFSKICHKKAA